MGPPPFAGFLKGCLYDDCVDPPASEAVRAYCLTCGYAMHLTCHALASKGCKDMTCEYCLKHRPMSQRVTTKTCPYCARNDSKAAEAFRCGNCFNFPHTSCLRKIVTDSFVKSVLKKRSLCLECYQKEIISGVPLLFDAAYGLQFEPARETQKVNFSSFTFFFLLNSWRLCRYQPPVIPLLRLMILRRLILWKPRTCHPRRN